MLRFTHSLKTISRVGQKQFPVAPKFPVVTRMRFSTGTNGNGEQKVEEPKVEGEAAATQAAPEVDEKVALHAEIKELKERVLRSLAEEENVRRIAKRDVDNAHTYANTSFAKAMLEVADDLERAIAIVPQDKRTGEDPALKSLVEGIEMTDKNLQKIFAKFGIVKNGKVDEVFDPHHHDALYQIPDASKPGTIGMVVKAGYKLKDRVIRAAQVGARVEPPN